MKDGFKVRYFIPCDECYNKWKQKALNETHKSKTKKKPGLRYTR